MSPYTRLTHVLSDLYPDIDSSILFIAEVGMSMRRVRMEATPAARWHFIVLEMRRAGLIPAALEIGLADYPANKDLQEIRVLLLPALPAPSYDLTKAVPPTATSEPLDRIVGGRLTTAFPDCCAIGDERGYFCSGTLIGSRLVVTAKHCSEFENGRVYLKGYDVSKPEDGEVIQVASKHLHPIADIMLLTLAHDATVPPRRVATSEEIDALAPTNCTLVGFGNTDYEGKVGYGIKRRVETPIVVLLSAGNEDFADFGSVSGIEMVAGHRGLNRDSCTGDSGGPLYVRDLSGDYLLLGATSRGITGGRTCGDGGIYCRLDKFDKWIEETKGQG